MSLADRHPSFPHVDVVTFGETMGLFTPMGGKGIAHSTLFEKSFGGAESNVAIGIARLGYAAGWCGLLGDDPIGRHIGKVLRGEGVDVSQARFLTDANTGLMLRETISERSAVYYYRKHSAASLMSPADLNEAYITNAKILHITGITPALSDSCHQTVLRAVEVAKSQQVKVCFDPNVRLKLWSVDQARPILLELAKMADYFLPGLPELRLLYQTDDFAEILEHVQALPGATIIKGGANETYVHERGKITVVPHVRVERPTDTVGAGDGFCAGFIVGLLKNKSLAESAHLGNVVGAIAVGSPGDWEALPTWEEVEQVLGTRNHIER
ncbi:sugar kinase [Laceyella sacchari]|jgi:2-dehydro-3-deoxygluconokinase|uniref:Sugar kinase n=1 Tax=Laceyella sacchari TaxID=37482 RepID=A0ABY5TY91_LACSH|nr:sugar kinase [Laceyella sacchari]TCW41773.1 2-dehydro-3-deoxygluconokinase [Laceyella sacchari]UWE02392.1 sugar kinase [Laceyella sacchari]